LERRGRSAAFAEPIRKRFARADSDTVAGSEYTDADADSNGNANPNAESKRHPDTDPNCDADCDANTNHTCVPNRASLGYATCVHLYCAANGATKRYV
jgi:hypothetical protein